MKQLLIIGAGGLAKEVYFLVKEINNKTTTWDILGFIDQKDPGKEIIDGHTVIGDDDFAANRLKGASVAIAQGLPETRKRLYELYKKSGAFDFPNLIHPNVIGDFENIRMGEANIIAPNCVLTTGIELGQCNLINISAIIAHDVRIKDFCVINPAANISGNVTLESCCLIGSNSTIHQGIKLAEATTLGLASALTHDTDENATYFGNPAKKILQRPPL